jgi:hypothetical protein
MRHRPLKERRCTYLVVLGSDFASLDDLRDLAAYLSELAVFHVDVVIVDRSLPPELDRNRRVLRWVGRHVIARPSHRDAAGAIDPIRAAAELAANDKVIVADARVRYSQESLDRMCALLGMHEVVEPQDYLDPLPWWGGIEAGRMLLFRGIGPLSDTRSTFGFRKSAVCGLRGINIPSRADACVRRLELQGAEIFEAGDVFVRRLPPLLKEWLRQRARLAESDLSISFKAVFFFGLLPLAFVLAIFGGGQLAGGYAGAIAFGSFVVAWRGRIGAASFFPWRACFWAPLCLVERSVSLYWAWLRRLCAVHDLRRPPIAVRNSGERVASG